VLVGVELRGPGRVDFQHLVALQRAFELLERGFGAFAQLFASGVPWMARPASRLSATASRLSAKLSTANLRALADLFIGAAAGVFGLGLGAQRPAPRASRQRPA
jgi:hypothetical protein